MDQMLLKPDTLFVSTQAFVMKQLLKLEKEKPKAEGEGRQRGVDFLIMGKIRISIQLIETSTFHAIKPPNPSNNIYARKFDALTS